jgi:hypothetical protein
MTISGFFQFIIGFILGIIFFSAGTLGAAYLFLTKMAVNPAKPTFPAEKQETVADHKPSPDSTNNELSSSATNSSEPQTKPEPEKQDDLPPGAYRARVTWSSGLSLRAEPSKDAERIGGVEYNGELIILNYSDDRGWQRVRIPDSSQEGWVKAGNVERIE